MEATCKVAPDAMKSVVRSDTGLADMMLPPTDYKTESYVTL